MMGGILSTRWDGIRTRATTGMYISLDISELNKAGGLTPGALAKHVCQLGDQNGGFETYMQRDGWLQLTYAIKQNGKVLTTVKRLLAIDRTPCNYGGSRPWLSCPDCGNPCRRIYCVNGMFACRLCHNLAYASSQLSEQGRVRRRFLQLRKRLDLDARPYEWDIPGRPAGMHGETYSQFAFEMRLLKYRHFKLVLGSTAYGRARLSTHRRDM